MAIKAKTAPVVKTPPVEQKVTLNNENTMNLIDDIFDDMHPAAKKVSDMKKMAKAKLTAKLSQHKAPVVQPIQSLVQTPIMPVAAPAHVAAPVVLAAQPSGISMMQKLKQNAKKKLQASLKKAKRDQTLTLSSQNIEVISPKISQIASMDPTPKVLIEQVTTQTQSEEHVQTVEEAKIEAAAMQAALD